MFKQAENLGVEFRLGERLDYGKADIVATGLKQRPKEIFASDTGFVFDTDLEDTAVFLLNDEAAYLGYAYLLIADGYGCIATVAFDRHKDLNTMLDKTVQILEETIPELQEHDLEKAINENRIGGVGVFSSDPLLDDGQRIYVGEAAGIQDLLWGFGIRTAVWSGHMAADAIIRGQDYSSSNSKTP